MKNAVGPDTEGQMEKKMLKGRRSVGILISAAVIILVILLNIGLSILAASKPLYVDVTKEKFNEISDASKEYLDKIDPKENNITIYFLADKDELQSPALGYSNDKTGSTSNLWGMKYIWELAQVFADSYSFIKVENINIKHESEKLEPFRTTVGTTFTKQDVIIDNYTADKDRAGNQILDSEGKPVMHHNFKIVKRDGFFVFDTETEYVYGFKGDLRFTSAIISLAGSNPTAYFVTGHGEKVGDGKVLDESVDSDYGKAQALRNLLFDAGYITKKIDLKTDYSVLFEDKSARIIVVFGPETDYSGILDKGSVDEIAVLRKFLNGADHNGLFFLDRTDVPLTNLEEYVSDYWGVTAENAFARDTGTNSLSSDGYVFASDYETDIYSVGKKLTDTLGDLTSRPNAIFENARILSIKESFKQSNGFYEDTATTYDGSVFNVPSSAEAVDYGGNILKDYGKENPDSVMVLCYEGRHTRSNEDKYTYVLICGTTGFTDDKYVNSASYCNSDILYYAFRLMSRNTVPFSIDFKVVSGESLTITKAQTIGCTVALCSVVPLTMLVLGAVVFFKRRNG